MPVIVRHPTPDGGYIECPASSLPGAFEAKAALAETFPTESCNKCKSTNTRYMCGQSRAGKTYYKVVCNACGAGLFMAMKPDGKGLFASRTNNDKSLKANNGWEVYERDGQAQTHPADQPDPEPKGDDSEIPF